jgi:hypothetical protein
VSLVHYSHSDDDPYRKTQVDSSEVESRGKDAVDSKRVRYGSKAKERDENPDQREGTKIPTIKKQSK